MVNRVRQHIMDGLRIFLKVREHTHAHTCTHTHRDMEALLPIHIYPIRMPVQIIPCRPAVWVKNAHGCPNTARMQGCTGLPIAETASHSLHNTSGFHHAAGLLVMYAYTIVCVCACVCVCRSRR